MNIGLLFFSYAGDAPLLALALQAVPRLQAQGHTVTAYVVDDAAAPLPAPPAATVYRQSSFDRCGNLNGLACITGMASVYAELAPAHDWLLKADCDTFVNHLQWLDAVDPATVGIVGSIHCNKHVSGACYAISAAGSAVLDKQLADPLWQGRATRAHCEDRYFYNALRMEGLALGRDNTANAIHPHLLHHDWYINGNQEFSALPTAAAVDFKACRWGSPQNQWAADSATALTRMNQYLETLNIKH